MLFGRALLETTTVTGEPLGETISLAITVVAAIFVFSGLLFGLTRGMYKTAIRLITIIASAILAFFAASMISDYVHQLFIGQTVEGLVTQFWPDYMTTVPEAFRDIINSFDAVTVERLLTMVFTMLAIPLIFTLAFLALKLVTAIIYFILFAILRVGDEKSGVSVLMGGLLGAVQGMIIAAIVLLPVSGLVTIAAESREPLISDKDPAVSENIEGVYEDYIDDIIANPVLSVIRTLGEDALFDSLTTVKIGEDEVHMSKEMTVFAEIVADGMPLTEPEFNWADLRDKDKKAMTAILSDVGEDDYTANLVAGILRGIANANGKGAINLGFEEPFSTFLNEFISIFLTSDKDNVDADLGTFLEVYFILNDYGVLEHFSMDGESGSAAEDLLVQNKDGKTVINVVIDELSENPRTQPLVTSLTKFSLKLMAQSAGNMLPDDVSTDEIYDAIKEGMENNVLSSVNDPTIPEEEKKDAVKESLNNTLIDSGVITEDTPLDDEIMDSIADHVMESFAGKETLTNDDINNAIFSYYNKYGIPEGTTPPPGIDIPDLGGGSDDGGGSGTEP